MPRSRKAARRPSRIAVRTTATGRFIVAPVYARLGTAAAFIVIEDKGLLGPMTLESESGVPDSGMALGSGGGLRL